MQRLTTRILIADDHGLVRHGLRLILDSQPDLEVVAEAGDGAEAVKLALTAEIDLAILDISMPRMTGIEAFHQIRAIDPNAKIILSSGTVNAAQLQELLAMGLKGSIPKPYQPHELVAMVRKSLAD